MTADTGESTASIHRRGDDTALGNVMAGLRAGGRLTVHHRIKRVALGGLPDDHPAMRGPKTLTLSRARRLLLAGVIVQSGIDQYRLARTGEGPCS